jgi:iron complex transport system substrate-binding protein
VIVFMPCGFGLERSAKEANLLLQTPEWQSLSAVKAGHVYATDGNSYFNRPGPRLIESAEILAEIFHPNLVEPTQEGTAWRRLIDLA